MDMIGRWAKRWSVPREAILDLQQMLGALTECKSLCVSNETATQAGIRLEASKKGARLWRNNVGAVTDERGRHIRYGLANDSKRMNREIKSSDLIGIKPVEIGGRVIGQFVAREVKRPGWVYSGTDRERAQLRFLELIAAMGGDACFATGEGTL